MPHDAYKALYVHIPFCKSRCNYCDFHTRAVKEGSPEVDAYLEGLVRDIRSKGAEGELAEVETVYIGGGTPTFAKSRGLAQLLYAIGTSMHLTPEVECTVEANPESLDERLVLDIWALGANRLSLGVQSFDDELLQTLGRIHTADDAKRAVNDAQCRFDNVSVDLMCGLPGQTPEQLESSIETAVGLGVTHVSIYPLTIEKGTKFERLMRKGRLHIPDEDTQADMMELACARLEAAGLRRYEVASYARPGFESRHNMSYWQGKPYLGIGESAVTMTQNAERRMRVQDGLVVDDLDAVQMAAEDLMLAMRMTAGVGAEACAAFRNVLPGFDETLAKLASFGLVEAHEGGWRPTQKGWLLGNELFGALLDLGA